MQADSRFYYRENNQLSPDWTSFAACYQPIVGQEAAGVYHYLVSFFDDGKKAHTFYDVMGHLEMPLAVLEQAFDRLSALGLLDMYQLGDDYLLSLSAPLSRESFLDNPLYHSLLVGQLGEVAVDKLRLGTLPQGAVRVSKTFAQVFDNQGQAAALPRPPKGFDLGHFKQQMAVNKLRFANEQEDTIGLYRLAEIHGGTWLELFQLAKQTAVEGVISIKRLEQAIEAGKASKPNLSQQEEGALKEYKRYKPLEFLTKIKHLKQAIVTQSERLCLQKMAEMGLLDEVINIVIAYSLSKTDSASLTENYVLKVANDLSYKGIKTAEQAIAFLRSPRTKSQKTAASQKDNVPEWSKEEVGLEPTPEERAQLEALRRHMQENEGQGGSR